MSYSFTGCKTSPVSKCLKTKVGLTLDTNSKLKMQLVSLFFNFTLKAFF